VSLGGGASRAARSRRYPITLKRTGNNSGFTLIELSVVVFIIGMVAAVTFPRLLPVIMFSQLEGSARQLGGYGRAAIAHAAFLKEEITIRFDFEKQELYAVHWVIPPSDEEGEVEPDQLELLNKFRSGGDFSPEDISQMLLEGAMGGASGLPDDFDQELADQQLADKFDLFIRRGIEQRAKNVIHDQSFMDEIGGLFDEKDVELGEDEEPIEEELADPVLRRTRIPDDVTVTEIIVNGASFKRGEVEILISPLGPVDDVIFYLASSENEYYTVLWDAVTGTTDVLFGAVDLN